MSDRAKCAPERTQPTQGRQDFNHAWANAAAQLYAESAQRWGQDRVNRMNVDKGDAAEALYLLMMGPDIYQLTGNNNAHRVGMAAIEFGVAPLMGGADIAKKEFTTNPLHVAQQATTDTLAAGGIATAQNFFPQIKAPLTGLMLTGLAVDQLSDKNLKRDAELAQMASRLDSRDPNVLVNDMRHAGQLLGPVAYDAGMIVATGPVGYKAALTRGTEKAEGAVVKDSLKAVGEAAKVDAPTLRDQLLSFCKKFLPDIAGGALSKEEHQALCSVYNSKNFGASGDVSKLSPFELLKDIIPASRKSLEDMTDIQARIRRNPNDRNALNQCEALLKKIDGEKKNFLDHLTDYIKRNSRNPEEVLIDSMKSARVLGFGDVHAPFETSGNRQLMITMLKELKQKGGATHFAIEMPKELQPFFDQFSRTPKGSQLVVPADLDLGDSVSPSLKGRLHDQLVRMTERHSEWSEFLQTARDCGLKIVCCDDQAAVSPFRTPRTIVQRDETIAKTILSVLAENPENKIVGLFGAAHWGKTTGSDVPPCAGDIIRKVIGNNQVVTTVSQLGDGEGGTACALYPFARSATAPSAVVGRAGGQAYNPLSELPLLRNAPTNSKFSDFDWVMMYPPVSR